MRWPWQKPRDLEGRDARVLATAHLQQANEQWPEVTKVSRSLRELRERNHFADQINYMLQGGHS